jgi:hypothetical protein
VELLLQEVDRLILNPQWALHLDHHHTLQSRLFTQEDTSTAVSRQEAHLEVSQVGIEAMSGKQIVSFRQELLQILAFHYRMTRR